MFSRFLRCDNGINELILIDFMRIRITLKTFTLNQKITQCRLG